ncbi:MAG: Transcription factor FapR [uncultured Sulfurimonas sp.]|nr:MAG: Transcription factor FapR [uncultured Sulfurimonas sp.]
MANEEELEEELQIDYDENEVMLSTHERVNNDLCGEVLVLERGYVETRLRTIPEMLADDIGLIHGGFIFGAADYAAMLAVNEKNVVLVASTCQFFSPVKFHDEVKFVARVRHKEGRKRNVNVEGYVLDIKVFEGEFKTVVTEHHVLKLKLLDENGENLGDRPIV